MNRTLRTGLFVVAATLGLALTACDDFPSVQEADTIEAYEAYLEANPSSRWQIQATSRLEELYLEKAKADATLEGYDRYLERFPDGHLKERAMKEREEFLFNWAIDSHTAEGWKKFLEEYPRAKKKKKEKAQRSIKVLELADKIEVGPVEKERVNLAEDPEGPLNGWGFYMDVTNRTGKEVSYLSYSIAFLDDEGNTLLRKDWPVVARYWPIPMEEEKKVPIKHGETRVWEWTDGNMPDGWSGKVQVTSSAIKFADEDPP